MAKPKAPKTYFKQVPLKIVMKVVAIESPDIESPGLAVTIKPPAKRTR
jgi:hypothetical protein